MNEGSNDLWQELSAMADAFGDLGRTMLIASRQLQNPGVLPPVSIDEQLAALRSGFAGLRGRSCRLAESLGVDAPAEDELTSLKALVGLLELVSAAEASRAERAAMTARAVAVLDRVLRLEHTQEEVFAPLVACQDRARGLRAAIEDGPAEGVAEEVAGLAEMDHPFGYLISLVEGVAAISDELWERLFDSVGNAFGRPLSAAVARAKIVERAAAAAVPDQAEAEAEAEPVAPAAVALNWGEWPRGLEEDTLVDDEEGPEELLSSVASESVSYIPRGLAALIQKRRLARAGRHRSVPHMERLETVRLLAANVISGFVYLDANNNGLFEKGETPVAADTVELVNSAGTVVGTATTDAQGAYSFSTDQTINTAPLTKTETVTVPATLTNFSQPVSLSQFDPSLGNLFQVDINVAGSLTSDIAAENTSVNSPATISSVISGKLALTAPGSINLTAPLNQPGTSFGATTYDGTLDFGGPSGHDFGDQTAKVSDTLSLKTSGGDDLSGFLGTGTLPASLAASATSTAEGGGNLMVTTHSSATATITITYHYTPANGLLPGDYKIVQVTEPPGTLNGLISRDGTVLPFNPGPGPDTIPVHVPVTTQGTTLPNNDFGELRPAEISGFVYYDKNKDGLKEAGEPGFAGIPVTLTGTNDLHQTISLPAKTGPGGPYDFPNLRPGTYSLSEPTAPKGFTNGLATEGNVAPIPGSDKTGLIPGITLVQGQIAPNNDFGKLFKPGSPGGQTLGPPPEVTAVYRLGIHHQTSTIVIVFDSPLDPVSASDVSNYRLVAASHGEFHGPAIPLASAVYDPAAHTVTLTPKSGHLNVFHHYQLSISGVKNLQGVLLDGNRDGKPGGTYVTIITRSNYPYPFPAPKPHAAAIASWVKRFPRLAAEWTSRHTPGLPT